MPTRLSKQLTIPILETIYIYIYMKPNRLTRVGIYAYLYKYLLTICNTLYTWNHFFQVLRY